MFSHGEIHCGCVVVAFQLSETLAGDGGFATIPGTFTLLPCSAGAGNSDPSPCWLYCLHV